MSGMDGAEGAYRRHADYMQATGQWVPSSMREDESGSPASAGGDVGSQQSVCKCGQFARGRCKHCKQPRCADHASLVDDAFCCSDCATDEAKQRREEIAELARQTQATARRKQVEEDAERGRRIQAERDERDRIAGLPLMTVPEVAAFLRHELEENVTHRLGPISGRDFAAALAAARKPQGEIKARGMFGQKKTLRNVGWTIAYISSGYSDPDSWYGQASPPVRLRSSGHAYVGHLPFDPKRVYRQPNEMWEPDVVRAYRTGNKKVLKPR